LEGKAGTWSLVCHLGFTSGDDILAMFAVDIINLTAVGQKYLRPIYYVLCNVKVKDEKFVTKFN